ncbi:hypothetical protein [Actinomadura livida]|uniref:Uncharacterized protein n=1 Tax=Actinomadura livida TaxID=79909 RepID=A0A7W7IJZ7_9ACTN|nr:MULTISPECIES: hypothetical protein [Actinomadura]MBB4778098.1 hypothetical protein [Actinomadura catellatispora]
MTTTTDDAAASGDARRAELAAVTCTEELARLLAEQYARADVSLRELELRTQRAGGIRLARTTCSDMLAGRRFPKKAMMVAFLRACQVPEEEVPDWERAWARVKLSQVSATQVSATQVSATRVSVAQPAEADEVERPVPSPPGDAGDGGAAAGRDVRPVMARAFRVQKPTRRRVVLVAGPAAALGLVAVIGFTAFTGPRPPRTVADDGRAFTTGGSSRFSVTVDPAHTEIRLTRRLDAIIGGQTATITVDGALAGVWQPLPAEARGWREQSVMLPPALTRGHRRLTITNTFVSSEMDFNEFTYFVDQKVDGEWSRADTVDVGPYHPGSEAAHQYRITRQNWAGKRDLSYLE